MTTDSPFSRQLTDAGRFIKEGDNFLVVSHINPDGDAVSSTLAIGEILRQQGKRYTLISEVALPDKFNFLLGAQQVIDYSQSPELHFDRVIAVDCADYSRIGKLRELFHEQTLLLNIDHHPTNDFFGTVHLIKPEAAATAEILYELAGELGSEWTKPLSELIYTGLMTDTGCFRYSNTTPHVLNIAAEMLQFGVAGNDIADRLLERMTLSQVKLLQRALSGLSFTGDGRIAWVTVSYQDMIDLQVSNEDLEGLVNYPRNIEGVEVGLLFKETAPGLIKVSMRSAGLVNVAELASFFGGGGHVRAAGCTINGAMVEAVSRIVEKTERIL